jgi:outer membrane protein assembly factor BamB
MINPYRIVAAFSLLPCLLFLIALRTTADPVPAPSVTLYRGDAGHTGYVADSMTTPLSLLWRYTAEPSANSTACPVYDNGIIYFSAGSHVYAVRAADGAHLWQYPAADDVTQKFHSTPTLVGSSLYIGNDNGDLDKIDAKTGELIWTQKFPGAIVGAPMIQNGVIYFGCGDYHLYAVNDNDTHDTRWSYATNGIIPASPIVGDEFVYFASSDENVYCLSKQDGHKIWSLQFNYDPSITPPAFADNILYIVDGSTLYAVNARNGETKWSQRLTGGGITTPPTIGPDFVGVCGLDGTVAVFNKQGKLRWRDNIGNPSYAPPLLTSNVFLVSALNGVLYALSSDSGKLLWEYVVPASLTKKIAPSAPAQVDSAPILDAGTLYVLSDDGSLSALSPNGLSSLPPRVTAMDPTPGSTVAGTGILPTGTLADEESGINPTTVSLSLDGQRLQHVVYNAGKSQVNLDTSSPDVNGPGKLDDGAHELVLKATDWRGNTVTQSWGFFVDNTLDPQSNTGGQ